MHVLIVDDDLATAELTAECLNLDGGISATYVGSGSAALLACANHRPDVILLDVDLPDISGLELAGQLKAVCNQTRIIMWSGMASKYGMWNLPPYVDAYLVKPVPFEVVRQQILKHGP